MKFPELKKYAEVFKPADALDRYMKPSVRHIVRNGFVICAGVFGLVVVMDLFSKEFPGIFTEQKFFADYIFKFRGIFFITSVLAIKMFLIETFYYSHISHFTPLLLRRKNTPAFYPVTYDVSRIIFKTPSEDVFAGFASSVLTLMVCRRLGISSEEFGTFLSTRTEKIATATFSVVSKDDIATYADYAKAVYTASPAFVTFLLSYGVTERIWNGVVDWMSRDRYRSMRERRFWSREMLGRIPSLGKDWAFGKAWTLMRYANIVQQEPFYRSIDESLFALYRKEFEDIETVLVRAHGANALVVSEDPENAVELVAMLGMAIERGYAYPQIEGKRVFFLRPSVLLESVSNKNEFEKLLTQILKEASDAGNVILAIENFALLVDTAHAYSSDIISIFGIFFSSQDLHVIALLDTHRYHDSIEPNKALTSFFEKVVVPEKDKDAVMRILEDEVVAVESEEKIFITYPALRTIVESAERYFADSFLYDKARDVLTEIGPFVRRRGKRLVEKEDILALFEEKTGIPQGKVTDVEKEKLLNLETALHRRVIGQNEAVVSIANALRRSRAGVGNPNRPIGSFLFLGPTGVGKTETTKALAESFFGSEDSIIRLDMSEYRTDDSLKRLIGSFDGNKKGILSTKLRENPYAVLLLDEFEKTNKEVLDLFLQILDEGFFSDMDGTRVNARNTIIIATSNAGSDSIFEYVKSGADLQSKKPEIISSIVEKGIFKPELINRFDGTILFHPLGEADLKKIAGLMLIKLESRLKDKGIRFTITDDLVSSVASKGMDAAFGARPMNRYIQEKIEALVADRIIRGEINQGDTIALSSAEI